MITILPYLKIHQSPDGTHPGVVAPPVTETLILARFQVVVTPPVVGLLVNEPVAIDHVAGVKVGDVVTVHEVGAVIPQLNHFTSHVEMFIQPHPEAATVLQKVEWQRGSHKNKNVTIKAHSHSFNNSPTLF